MRNIVNFLKNTIDKNAEGIRKCLIIKNGQIYTYGSSMTAGGKLQTVLPIVCNLPASEVENTLSRMSTDPEIIYSDNTITLRSGKLRATIRCYDGDAPEPLLNNSNVEWKPSPFLLSLSLKKAVTFIGDTGVFSGIRLQGNRITAMFQAGGIDIELKNLEIDPEITITKETAEFLAKQEPPNEIATNENSVCCRWKDGKWFRAQVLTNGLPNTVETVFNDAGEQAPIYITEEWRTAFEHIAATCDGNITIHAGGFVGTKGAGRVDFEFNTGLPEGHVSHWSVKALKPMLEAGTVKWNPEAYPKIVRFTGPDFRGIVMGLQR